MSPTRDLSGSLLLDGVRLSDVVLAAGTPTYVYDLDGIAGQARSLRSALPAGPSAHLIAYSIKANAAGPIVRALAGEGCGADVVSGAELRVALACGINPERIVYSGVAKQDDELDFAVACGDRGIGAVQIESVEEIARVEARARTAGRRVRIGIRVNPSIDLGDATHAHISTGHDDAKFGVRNVDVPRAVQLAEGSQWLELAGMTTHVGSKLPTVEPYLQAARILFQTVRGLREAGALRALAFVNTGGGFSVDYGGGPVPGPADFARAVVAEQRAQGLSDFALYVEPGRALVAPFGVLIARVIQPKVTDSARFLMIDAGMNDLIRPALYQARHRIVPLEDPPRRDGMGLGSTLHAANSPDAPGFAGAPSRRDHWCTWQVVGPVCESSDDFGEHALPREPPASVAILDAGAYGFTMASRYNGRQLPAEVFVRGGAVVGKTERESVETWARERAMAGT
jgi:diaminopimelate decarboxylase